MLSKVKTINSQRKVQLLPSVVDAKLRGKKLLVIRPWWISKLQIRNYGPVINMKYEQIENL